MVKRGLSEKVKNDIMAEKADLNHLGGLEDRRIGGY
jgi:hypothetical protein